MCIRDRDNEVEGGVVEGRLFAGRIAALLADSHLAGSALAPVGDGGDRGLTGAAAGDTAIAVHGSHGGAELKYHLLSGCQSCAF